MNRHRLFTLLTLALLALVSSTAQADPTPGEFPWQLGRPGR